MLKGGFAAVGEREGHTEELAFVADSFGDKDDVFTIWREDREDVGGGVVREFFDAAAIDIDDKEVEVLAIVAVGGEDEPASRWVPVRCPVDARFVGELFDVVESVFFEVGDHDVCVATSVEGAPRNFLSVR